MKSLGLAGLFALVGLCATRVLLVAHEFVGHAFPAWLSGGHLTAFGLWFFGGGWVQYDGEAATPTWQLIISLGGIGLEALVAFAALWGLGRATNISLRLVLSVLVWLSGTHSAFYLASGLHYGRGDGRTLYQLLPAMPMRALLVILATLAVCWFAWLGAKLTCSNTQPWLGGFRRRKLMTFGAVVAFGAAIHGGGLLSEIRIRQDAVHAKVFEKQFERDARQRTASFVENQKKIGKPPTSDQIKAFEAEELRRREPFPLLAVLVALILVSSAIGTWQGSYETAPRCSVSSPAFELPVLLAISISLVSVWILTAFCG